MVVCEVRSWPWVTGKKNWAVKMIGIKADLNNAIESSHIKFTLRRIYKTYKKGIIVSVGIYFAIYFDVLVLKI